MCVAELSTARLEYSRRRTNEIILIFFNVFTLSIIVEYMFCGGFFTAHNGEHLILIYKLTALKLSLQLRVSP